MDKLTLPNLLSLSRLCLAALICPLMLHDIWLPAALLLWLAIASDIMDGFIARWLGQTSALGGLLDHSCDALFVIVLLATEAQLDIITWFLPTLVLVAFSQYVLDSNALKCQPLKASIIGRYNGILYYVMAGLPIMQHALQIYPFNADFLHIFAYLLVATTLVSMLDRLIALLKSRS